MQKRFIILFLASVFLICSMLTASAEKYFYDNYWRTHDEIVSLYVNAEKVECDVPPIIVDGRTLVPVRSFFENMGAAVDWDDENKKVTITKSEYQIELAIDSRVALINDAKTLLDVPAKIITDENGNGRTMIPLRFISESMGYNVSWNQETLTVAINKPDFKCISDIKAVQSSKDEDIIIISVSELIKPKIVALDSPKRLVFDFYDTVLDVNDYSLNESGNYFSNVRYSNHENYARVVVDLTEECTYETESDGNTFKIYLTSAQNTPNDNIGEKLVVIDAGHGGYDPGAIGYEDEKDVLHESDVNLDISKKVYDILKDRGVNAVLTRSADVYVGLSERAEVANDLDASLFISVHINSSTIATAHGSMTFYYNSGEDTTTEDTYGISSKKLAEIIQKHLIAHGGRYDRGISDGSKFVVLKSTIMPAVLVECAFISNDEERELLKTDSFRQSLAEGIAEGIIEALKTMGERKPSENQDTEKAISN